MVYQRGAAIMRGTWKRFKSLRTVTPSFAIVSLLIVASTGRTLPAQADEIGGGLVDRATEAVADPVASTPANPASRLQLIIKTIDVSNDRDGALRGAGDMELMATVWRCTGPNPPCSASENFPAELLAKVEKNFDADSGQSVNLNRLIPSPGDPVNTERVSEEGGIEVYAGQSYVFEVNMFESDGFAGGDFMGGIQRIISQSNDWGVGTYTREAAGHFPDASVPSLGLLCAGCGGVVVGDYLVTYEIRRMALPDLQAKSMRVKEAPGGGDPFLCSTIENPTGLQAGPAFIAFGLDGNDKRSTIMAGLDAHASREECLQAGAISLGQHTISVIVDDPRILPESDESNNALTEQYRRTALSGVLDPTRGENGVLVEVDGGNANPPPTTDPVATDISVTDIKVQAKSSNSRNNCDPGPNDVTIGLKNNGGGDAQNVTVHLQVDSQPGTQEKTISSVASGKPQDVTFEGVQLDRGDHMLTATVGAGGNNKKIVNVKCQEGNG